MAAARSSIARAARQLASPAATRPAPACLRAPRPAPRPRLFSVSAAAREKKYTEDHEWIELSADGKTCTLGISDYAAKALGDVVYIELPQTGIQVSQGDAIGAVESVKSASDILTPVSGTVSEVNSKLEKTPANINKDPEGDAWIAKITVLEDPSANLMTKAEYTAFTEDA
ncbi:glycine cleavage system H-protein subunit [Pleosporales sp. CAS-2024a]